MLKETYLEKIYENIEDYDIELDPFNCNITDSGSEEIAGDDTGTIHNIIVNNIGIQIALADIILNCGYYVEERATLSFVFFDEKPETLLEELKQIFRGVHKVYNVQHEIIACEVYSPTMKAKKVFIEAYKRKQLNKWIEVFHSEKVTNDCKKIALYSYTLEDDVDLNIQALQEDDFFKYVLFGDKYGVGQPGFDISQYLLQEIDDVPYIREIAHITDNLYILISRSRGTDGGIVYRKYLTWDKVNHEKNI